MFSLKTVKFSVGLLSAVVAFFLTQPDVVLSPPFKVALMAINVGLTYAALELDPNAGQG